MRTRCIRWICGRSLKDYPELLEHTREYLRSELIHACYNAGFETGTLTISESIKKGRDIRIGARPPYITDEDTCVELEAEWG